MYSGMLWFSRRYECLWLLLTPVYWFRLSNLVRSIWLYNRHNSHFIERYLVSDFPEYMCNNCTFAHNSKSTVVIVNAKCGDKSSFRRKTLHPELRKCAYQSLHFPITRVALEEKLTQDYISVINDDNCTITFKSIDYCAIEATTKGDDQIKVLMSIASEQMHPKHKLFHGKGLRFFPGYMADIAPVSNTCIHEFINLNKQAHVPSTLQCLPCVWWLILQLDTMLWCELNDNTVYAINLLDYDRVKPQSHRIVRVFDLFLQLHALVYSLWLVVGHYVNLHDNLCIYTFWPAVGRFIVNNLSKWGVDNASQSKWSHEQNQSRSQDADMSYMVVPPIAFDRTTICASSHHQSFVIVCQAVARSVVRPVTSCSDWLHDQTVMLHTISICNRSPRLVVRVSMRLLTIGEDERYYQSWLIVRLVLTIND